MENNELIMNEEVNNELEVYETCDSERKGLSGLGIGTLVVGGIAAAIIIYRKNRAKIEARKIEKLRKKGYVIYHESEAVDAESCDVSEVK